jgi:hypothetical protein
MNCSACEGVEGSTGGRDVYCDFDDDDVDKGRVESECTGGVEMFGALSVASISAGERGKYIDFERLREALLLLSSSAGGVIWHELYVSLAARARICLLLVTAP